jgi:hypothetical protein
MCVPRRREHDPFADVRARAVECDAVLGRCNRRSHEGDKENGR